eukprot:6492730-Amphidinium_carterae.11
MSLACGSRVTHEVPGPLYSVIDKMQLHAVPVCHTQQAKYLGKEPKHVVHVCHMRKEQCLQVEQHLDTSASLMTRGYKGHHVKRCWYRQQEGALGSKPLQLATASRGGPKHCLAIMVDNLRSC